MTCTKFPVAGQRKPTLHIAFSFKVTAKEGIFYSILPGDSTFPFSFKVTAKEGIFYSILPGDSTFPFSFLNGACSIFPRRTAAYRLIVQP
jgi:hypothetical protein